MSLHVKKGDNVLVIAGKDKGKQGKILFSNPTNNTVVVAGVNIISKHSKPKKAGEKGGITKIEGKINSSNVQIICSACNKATRVAHGLDGEKKFRKCKKCGASLDAVVKVAKKETAKKETTKKTTATTTPKTAEKVVEKVAEEKKTPEKKTVAKPAAEKVETKKKTTTTKTTTKKSSEK